MKRYDCVVKNPKAFAEFREKNSRCYYWINIPVEWYNYFNTEDYEYIAGLWKKYEKTSKIIEQAKNVRYGAKPWSAEDRQVWNKRRAIRDEKNNFKRIIRHRRASMFCEGLYVIRTASAWLMPVQGKHLAPSWERISWEARPKKGNVITWVEKDEQNRQIFLWKNRLWAGYGTSLDGISKV